MSKKKKVSILPILAMGGLFVLVDLLAFLVAGPFEAAGAVAFQNPSDPWNIVYFFSILVVFTVVILLIIKFQKKQAMRIIFLSSTTVLSIYVLYPILTIFIADVWVNLTLSVATSAVLLIALIKKPEWYITNAIAILTGVGAIALIGISLDILLVIVLLIVMAAYDAFSVYKSKHMIDLADNVMDLKLPVMFVIPKRRDYSLLKETKSLKEKLNDGTEREAYFLGVGDLVFPGILAVATFHNIAGNGLIIALSVLAGTLIGFMALMTFAVKGKPQAGLPFLCSGAILGYIVAFCLLFGALPI
ncbi:MAG: presenilin family intramembrane aspartyl protease [Candidatus Bathyarchaeota archaeon]|nr:presenilin family intramembrane aspartyl protease [Candidatus Bathyarchaeota archaeon]